MPRTLTPLTLVHLVPREQLWAVGLEQVQDGPLLGQRVEALDDLGRRAVDAVEEDPVALADGRHERRLDKLEDHAAAAAAAASGSAAAAGLGGGLLVLADALQDALHAQRSSSSTGVSVVEHSRARAMAVKMSRGGAGRLQREGQWA